MSPDNVELRKEFVEYRDGQTVFEGYAAYDASIKTPRPCVLVGHDWSGQSDVTRGVAERLARLGYVGFALDAYGKGIRGSLAGDSSALMNPLMADRALLRSRLLAGFEAAKRHHAVLGTRIAAIGYCFGGLCALDLARAVPQNLTGVVSFHGNYKPPEIAKQLPILAKVLILHGWEDPINPPADVLAIAHELTDARADWQLHAYGRTQHSFTFVGANFPERGIVYNAAADRRSWASMRAFLEEVLA